MRDAVVDTGADDTFLSPSLARSLGARSTGRELRIRTPGAPPSEAREVRIHVALPGAGCAAWTTALVVPGASLTLGHPFLQRTSAHLSFAEPHGVACGIPPVLTVREPSSLFFRRVKLVRRRRTAR